MEFTSPIFPDISSREEIDVALSHMKEKFKDYPNVHFVGLGMSLGANFMMKAAGELKENFPLEAIISFNNPFNVW